jgi:hypothetical protein
VKNKWHGPRPQFHDKRRAVEFEVAEREFAKLTPEQRVGAVMQAAASRLQQLVVGGAYDHATKTYQSFIVGAQFTGEEAATWLESVAERLKQDAQTLRGLDKPPDALAAELVTKSEHGPYCRAHIVNSEKDAGGRRHVLCCAREAGHEGDHDYLRGIGAVP